MAKKKQILQKEPKVVAKRYLPPREEERLPVVKYTQRVMRPGAEDAQKIKSLSEADPIHVSREMSFLDVDANLLRREQLAEQEKIRKSMMVAPLYSKGPYQYLGDCPKEIVEGLGRKL